MPSSILNLKFKGNKSFVAFSNLGDSDSLTKTWKVCSKVASYLEQGQRLENLSWRLWHLQNLMVETDNARSKREFKKLSKCMGDKLDKEKGRSIEELEAPGYKRNQSSEKIRQRAEEKERTREANSVRPGGTIRRMQFTFSVDKPASLAGSTPMAVDKPDLKPSQQFKDTVHRRGRPASRAAPAHDVSTATSNDKDPPLSSASPDEVFGNMHQNNAQGDGMVDVNNDSNESDGEATPSMTDSTGSLSLSSMTSLTSNSTSADSSPSLRFPSIFNNDFGPSVLFYNQPSLSASLSYGEGMTSHASSGEGFSINRPTIELPLDELLNDLNTTDTGSTGSWSPENLASSLSGGNNQDDIDMKPMDMHNMHMQNHNQHGITSVNGGDPIDIRMKNYSNGEDNLDLDSPLSQAGDGLGLGLHLPATVQMSQVWNNNNNNSNANSNNNSNGNNTSNSTSTSSQHPNRPTLSVKTSSSSTSTITTSGPNSSSRPIGPSATAMSSMNPTLLSGGNSAPGGVKAECSNCGATHTPLWRRGLNDELNCNACGLYCKLHKRPRPKSMRNTHGEGRTQTTPRLDSIDALGEPAQCYNCHTMATPLWRKDDEGKTVCNACGLYFKLHGSARPISMKSDVIRKRSRHDARRGGSGGDIPSASPGASRRASPAAQTQTHSSPLLAADSSNQSEYSFPDEYDLNSASTPQQSEMSPLTADSNAQGAFSSQGTYDSNLSFSSFPGPYHPDLLFQHHPDSLSFASGEISEDTSDGFGTGNANRSNKRRRMSNDSASEPPSSTTSYSSFDQSTSQFQQSIRSALDFPFNAYMNYGNNSNGGRNSSDNAFWHPPMVPQEKSPQTLIHPPMLPPPDDSPMDFLHPPMLPQDDADQLFGSYVHRPMVLTDSPMPQVGSLYPHPPMVLSDNMYANFSQAQGQAEFYEHNSSNNNNYSSSN